MHTPRLAANVQSRDACIYFYLNIWLFKKWFEFSLQYLNTITTVLLSDYHGKVIIWILHIMHFHIIIWKIDPDKKNHTGIGVKLF